MLTGIFITMPIVTVKLGGKNVSIFSLLMIFVSCSLIIDTLFSKNKFKLGKTGKLYASFFCTALISSLFGLMYYEGNLEWSSAVLVYIPKIITFLLALILISMSKNKESIISNFLKGFLIGCVLNISWSVIEGFTYYIFHYSLNDRIFADYATTINSRQYITIINKTGIRASGFNFDPAHLGIIIPIVVLYSLINKKNVLLLLSILAIIFSQSTTALICSILVIVVNLKNIKSNYNKRVSLKLKLKAFSFIVFMIIVLILSKNSEFITSIQKNLDGFNNRTTNTYINNDQQSPHILYYIYLPKAILFNGIKTITGTGFGTASFPYLTSPEIRNSIGLEGMSPYDPETTYISYLFDTGIIGLLLYIVLMVKIYKYFHNKCYSVENSIIIASTNSIIFGNFFYHYILTAYQVMIIIMVTILMDNNKDKQLKINNKNENSNTI